MKHSAHQHSRHQLRCLLTRFRGNDVGDALDAAVYSPLSCRGETEDRTQTGHLIAQPDSSRKSCDMPDDLPF